MKRHLIIEEVHLEDVERAFNAIAERIVARQARAIAEVSDNLYLLKTWFTRAEAARYVSMSESWVKAQEDSGMLPVKRLGNARTGSPRYRKADLDHLIESL